jgi:hypothetical protein
MIDLDGTPMKSKLGANAILGVSMAGFIIVIFVQHWLDGTEATPEMKLFLSLPGFDEKLLALYVNYADDFVICCRGTAEEAMAAMRNMMIRLKLTVNERKTKLCQLPEQTFDFLGYTFGRYYSGKTGRAYFCPRTFRKKIRQPCCRLLHHGTAPPVVVSQAGLRTRNTSQYSYQHRYHKLGLVHLPKLAATFRGRKHDKRS